MLRSYRHIIFALVGFLTLAAANPKQAATNPQSNAEQQQGRPLDGIAPAIQDAAKPSEHDKECPQGDDRRSSDLCAQWKAADAARSASHAAWWLGILGSVIGALTLAAAWKAALYARDAATHTQTGAKAAQDAVDETQRIGEAQVRCYLTGVSAEVAFTEEGTIIVCSKIRNTGQSPARCVKVSGNVTIRTAEGHKVFDGPDDTFSAFEVDVGAGMKEEIDFSVKGVVDGWVKSEGVFYYVSVTASIFARDVFGKDVFETERFSGTIRDLPKINTWVELTRSSRVAAKKA